VLRLLLWRLLGLVAVLVGAALVAWCLDGGLGRSLRGGSSSVTPEHFVEVWSAPVARVGGGGRHVLAALVESVTAGLAVLSLCLLVARFIARRRRRYVRLWVEPYRSDTATRTGP
jgi:hypothetical protein